MNNIPPGKKLTKKVNTSDPTTYFIIKEIKDNGQVIPSTEMRDIHNNLIAKIDNTSTSDMIAKALKGGVKK